MTFPSVSENREKASSLFLSFILSEEERRSKTRTETEFSHWHIRPTDRPTDVEDIIGIGPAAGTEWNPQLNAAERRKSSSRKEKMTISGLGREKALWMDVFCSQTRRDGKPLPAKWPKSTETPLSPPPHSAIRKTLRKCFPVERLSKKVGWMKGKKALGGFLLVEWK